MMQYHYQNTSQGEVQDYHGQERIRYDKRLGEGTGQHRTGHNRKAQDRIRSGKTGQNREHRDREQRTGQDMD